ncbi:MAG: ABC transporter ATP-binding protein [Lachnospiraceae bacterium]|nr:ABC transporter ATP-binding protein [Lachnospiraceae bacterium]
MKDYALYIEDLHTGFYNRIEDRIDPVLNGITFGAERGKILGVVGESGSGKSVTMLSVMRLLGPDGRTSGRILMNGDNMLEYSDEEMRRIRGGKIAMIFQDPMTTLNPVFTIGDQIREVIRLHRPDIKNADEYIIGLLNEVGISDGARRLRQYPHELSGGRRQRIVIAMALAGNPDILIADEPTTALDVTVQAQILELIQKLTKEHNMTTIMITHDLGIVANLCDNVVVLYGGRICETGTVREIFKSSAHEYTRGLLCAIPGAVPGKRLIPIDGVPANRSAFTDECAFCPRCKNAMKICTEEFPPVIELSETHKAWCWMNFVPASVYENDEKPSAIDGGNTQETEAVND